MAAGGKDRLGILVHGCHLMADGWEDIVWGRPPEELGRLPHAALLAWEERERLELLCLGTGASKSPAGELEADATLAFLLARVERLKDFRAFDGVPLDALAVLLRKSCVTDVGSQNTNQEVREALSRFTAAGCDCAMLISSPTHLPRCLASACAEMQKDPRLFTGSLLASPCDTSYRGYTAADVVVVEPPHRGDRDRALDERPFHTMVQRSFRIAPDRRARFLTQFEELLEAYEV